MKQNIFLLVSILLTILFEPGQGLAQDNIQDNIVLAKAPVDIKDIASIKRGAKFFATNCMSCHTAVYLRYNQLAKEAGVDYAKMPITVKDWPYGIRPPDLSLEAEVHGPDWIYTYLHSFYRDPARPTGFNNLVLPNTAMPPILGPYQGEQTLVVPRAALFHAHQWYDLLELTHQGSLTAEQFDRLVTDLVNFLVYAAAPYTVEQQHIGWWVLGMLLVLCVLMYFLKQEYWEDVHRQHKRKHDK